MMTMLVASFDCACRSLTGDRLRFTSGRSPSVMVGGLVASLILAIFVPTLYVWVAGDQDVLPEREAHAHFDPRE